MPITNCEATPQTPAPGCCPTRLLEQSLTDLMQRLCSSTWALSAREADAVVAVVSDVLLQSSAATERELILALSCTAMLSTRQGAGTALMAARGNLSHQANGAPSHLAFASADASNTTVVSSSPPSDALSTSGPAVLPLLPLLAAVAAGDEAAAEMALRRLNRCLGRPLSAANPIAATTVQCAATNTPSIRSNRIWSSNGDGQGGGEDLLAGCYADTTLGSLSSLLLAPEDDGEFRSLVRGEWEGARGSLASSRGGGDDSVCSSGALAAASWESARYRSRCCLSLLAAQQAEARLVVEAERCKLAAARLCGCRARSEAAAAEAESLQGACVAALAAAAADVRCHQELLGSLALKALPRLLSSSATAPYAAVLAHNLAVPTSVCFRHQLRRRGVLPPLFDYLGHLTPPPSTPPHHQHYHQQQQQCPGLVQDLAEGAIAAVNLTGLTVVLEAITCLCAGREGADALRQPQLDALKRLGALWERLEAVTKPSWCSRGPQSVGLSGGSGSGTNKATGSYDGEALLTVHRLLNGLLERLPVEVPLEPSGCGRVAPDRGLEVKAPRADRGRVGRRGEQRDGRRTAANTGGANVGTGEEASASCLSFQSQVLVDGRPMQLVTTITRTARSRPDGTEDVHYEFLDQVSPDPAPGEAWRQQQQQLEGDQLREPLRTDVTVPPRRLGRNPASPPRTCCQSSSFWLHKEPPTQHRNGQNGPVHLQDSDVFADATKWPPDIDQQPAVGRTCNSAAATAVNRLSFGLSSASAAHLEPGVPPPSPQLTHLASLAKQAGTYLFETPLGRKKRTSLR